MPASYQTMLAFPPEGYEYVQANSVQENLFKALSGRNISYTVLRAIDELVPTSLLKAWSQRRRRPPSGTSLTYAHHHLVLRNEPWVVETEYAGLLLGDRVHHISRFRHHVEEALSSTYFRGIRCWSEAARRTLVEGCSSAGFKEKVEVIPHAVPLRRFVKELRSGGIKLLFVGSGNIAGQFYVKGGNYLLDTFQLVRQRFPEAELVIRSDMPAPALRRANQTPGVKVLHRMVPWDELEREYLSADVFLLPSHTTPPFTILDAMSYELPVVSLDVWANGEYVADGKTGLLARPPKAVPYYYKGTSHPNFGSREFGRAVSKCHPEVVKDLAGKIGLLIENPETRRAMGRAARWEVEHGRFSIARRNEQLTAFFDKALGAS